MKRKLSCFFTAFYYTLEPRIYVFFFSFLFWLLMATILVFIFNLYPDEAFVIFDFLRFCWNFWCIKVLIGWGLLHYLGRRFVSFNNEFKLEYDYFISRPIQNKRRKK